MGQKVFFFFITNRLRAYLEADSVSRNPVLDHIENNINDCITIANNVCLNDIILDQPPSPFHIIKDNVIYCVKNIKFYF